MRLQRICTTVIFMTVFLSSFHVFLSSQESIAGLTVEVRPNKTTYVVGEPVSFSVTLKNNGAKPVYISKSFSEAGGGISGFYIHVKQLTGRASGRGIGVATDGFDLSKRSADQILREDYLLLWPGQFVGYETPDTSGLVQYAGTYEVTATYAAQDCNVSKVQLAANKSGEVVTGRYRSAPVMFTVRKTKRKSLPKVK